MKTWEKGRIACLKVEQRAYELGYLVSRPTVEESRYDLILDKNGVLTRVQVKYADCQPACSSGSLAVHLNRMSNGKYAGCYLSSDIDALLVYFPSVEKIAWFPADQFDGKQTLTVRTEPAKNGQQKNIRLLDDFIW